jgi:AcrR family transcriptional regulator
MAAEPPSAEKVRAGRRPGRPDTRALILQSAKTEFAEKGFDRATLRFIAARAGVDPALVHHYFGSKDDLLLAALEVPFDPREVVPELTAAGAAGLGVRIAERFVSIWDSEERRLPLVALVRTSLSSEAGSVVLRDGLARMILEPISAVIDAPNARLRAQFVASQLLGMAVARYVLRLEPLASAPPEVVVSAIAPTLQRYVDGEA